MNIINFSHSAVNPIINYSITDSSSLADLVPKEIWQKIASFLNDCKDVIHLGLSNRHLCVALLFDVPLWEIFCQRDFPDSSTHPQSNLPAPALYKQLAIVANHMKTPGHYRLKTLTAHDGKVQNIEHYKGMLVSSGSGDETIKIWDLKTGKVIQTLETGQPVEHISIYDRTKLISVGEDDMIQIFDLETKKLQQILNTNQPNIISIAVYDD